MKKPSEYNVVYSTDHGRMCPECGKPTNHCTCKKEDAEPPPGDGIVRVALETRHRNGKAVTTIRGLGMKRDALETMTKEFKKLCGSGGTCKDWTIEIQGDHRDEIERVLQSRGYKIKRSGG